MTIVEIGFFDTPDKFWSAIVSLDTSIQKLRGAVGQPTPKGSGINTAWRAEFAKFVRRWELERDQYKPYTARLLLSVPNQRLQAFKEAYLWWASDFERKAKRPVPGKPPPEEKAESPSASLVPDELWWIIGAGVVVFALASAIRR